MRFFPQYRGVRVRPWMRHLNKVLVSLFYVCFITPFGYLAYLNQDQLLALDYFFIGLLATIALGLFPFSIYVSWLYRECTPLGKKWDRLRVIARYLFEHGFVYEKKSADGTRKSYRFPKVYVKQRKFDLDISFELAGGKFQDRFLKLGGELETTLFMDFVETQDDLKYKTYTMAYSAYLNRITVPEVVYEPNKGLKLMKNFYWDFDRDPHFLVSGGTGGGKTVLLRTLVLGLAKIGPVFICDPKRADFVSMQYLEAFKGRVVFGVDDIIAMFSRFYNIMEKRYQEMERLRMKNKEKDLGTYWHYDLEPHFLVCDEFNALMAVIKGLPLKDQQRFNEALTAIVAKGRAAGCFFIGAMQKASREDLPSKVQANVSMRMITGRVDDDGYQLMFGTTGLSKRFRHVKFLSGRRVYGHGYIASFGDVPRESFSPELPKDFIFYDAYATIPRYDCPFENDLEEEIKDDLPPASEVVVADSRIIKKTETVETAAIIPVNQVAKTVGLKNSQVFKVMDTVESMTVRTFERQEGKRILRQDDVAFLTELCAMKTDDLSWTKTIEAYCASKEV